MGHHPWPGTEHNYRYERLLTLPDDRPVTIYADMSDGLRSIYVPKDLTDASRVKPLSFLPQPMSIFNFGPPDAFFFSKAALEDTFQIRICRNKEQIIGLLLGYSNGTWASIGSVKLDQLQSALRVDPAGIWIQSTYTGGRWQATRAHIVNVARSEPKGNRGEWLHVRWRGELEWWYSGRQCEVHYEDKHTLRVV